MKHTVFQQKEEIKKWMCSDILKCGPRSLALQFNSLFLIHLHLSLLLTTISKHYTSYLRQRKKKCWQQFSHWFPNVCSFISMHSSSRFGKPGETVYWCSCKETIWSFVYFSICDKLIIKAEVKSFSGVTFNVFLSVKIKPNKLDAVVFSFILCFLLKYRHQREHNL